MAKAELLLTAAIDSLLVFFVYDVPISEQYFFPAPGEGVGTEGFVECAVGIAVHFFLCHSKGIEQGTMWCLLCAFSYGITFHF